MLALLSLLILTLAPPSAPAVAATGETYRVPYQLAPTNHLLVRAKINGKGPYTFIIDTGAPAVFFARDTARKIGLIPDKTGWGTLKKLEIEGGPMLTDAKARLEDPAPLLGMNALGLAGGKIDGIFGYTLLSRYKLDIDLTQSRMIWTRMDYNPATLESLAGMMHGKLTNAPAGVNQMQDLAKYMSSMSKDMAQVQTVGRGFFGMELADRVGAVQIASLLPGSPAALAGLMVGDTIAKITTPDGEPHFPKTSAEVLDALSQVGAEEKARFVLQRKGKQVVVLAQAGKAGL